jgi:hypothetical protein
MDKLYVYCWKCGHMKEIASPKFESDKERDFYMKTLRLLNACGKCLEMSVSVFREIHTSRG